MTRTRTTHQPVSSFGPQLLAALLKGARERVEIPCPDQRTMKWLQLRIQTLRGAMAREKHPQFTLVTRARTSRSWDAKKGINHDCKLIIQPHDIQFTPMLDAAGITLEGHEQELLEGMPESSPSVDPTKVVDDAIAYADPYAKFKED